MHPKKRQYPPRLVILLIANCITSLSAWADEARTKATIQELKKRLRVEELDYPSEKKENYEKVKEVFQQAFTREVVWPNPGIAVGIPVGFGSEWKTVFAVGSITTPPNFVGRPDLVVSLGGGLGDPQTLGVDVTLGIYSIFPPLRSGGVSVKLHHRFPFGLAIALGRDNVVQWNALSGSTNYGVASYQWQIRKNPNSPFSTLFFHVGAGSGIYNLNNVVNGSFQLESYWSILAGTSVKALKFMSFNVSWVGFKVMMGLAFSPFKDVPITFSVIANDPFSMAGPQQFTLVGGFAHRF